jgi:hypothetical protein
LAYDVPAGFAAFCGRNRELCSRQAKCAKNRVLKARRPIPDLDIYFFRPLYPFRVSGIYSFFISGDVIEDGVNVAKMSKVQYCKIRQNEGKIRQNQTIPHTDVFGFRSENGNIGTIDWSQCCQTPGVK